MRASGLRFGMDSPIDANLIRIMNEIRRVEHTTLRPNFSASFQKAMVEPFHHLSADMDNLEFEMGIASPEYQGFYHAFQPKCGWSVR